MNEWLNTPPVFIETLCRNDSGGGYSALLSTSPSWGLDMNPRVWMQAAELLLVFKCYLYKLVVKWILAEVWTTSVRVLLFHLELPLWLVSYHSWEKRNTLNSITSTKTPPSSVYREGRHKASQLVVWWWSYLGWNTSIVGGDFLPVLIVMRKSVNPDIVCDHSCLETAARKSLIIYQSLALVVTRYAPWW